MASTDRGDPRPEAFRLPLVLCKIMVPVTEPDFRVTVPGTRIETRE